jgi:hypothetical protein
MPTSSGHRRSCALRHASAAAVVALIVVLAACASASVPTAPTGVTVTPGDGLLVVGFTPGAGTPAVTAHQVSLDDGATWLTLAGDSRTAPVTVGDLENGVSYIVRVRAVNAQGTGPASAAVRSMPLVATYARITAGVGGAYAYGTTTLADSRVFVVGGMTGSDVIFETDERFDTGPRYVAFAAILGGDGTWEGVAAGEAGPSAAVDAAALPDGGALVLGTFSEVATFGEHPVSALGSGLFVATIDQDGTWRRAVSASGASSFKPAAIDVQPDGGALVAGSFQASATFGASTVTATDEALFVARLDPDGEWEWVSKVDAGFWQVATDLVALPDGGAIVVGYLEFDGASIDFPPLVVDRRGQTDLFVGRITAEGVWTWVTTAGHPDGEAWASSVALAGSGLVVTGGRFREKVTFGAETYGEEQGGTGFVAALDLDEGAWRWVAMTVAATDPTQVVDVAAHPDGGIVIVGTFTETIVIDEVEYENEGDVGPFVAYLGDPGDWRWVAVPDASTGPVRPHAITTQPDGGVIVVGEAQDSVTFGDVVLVSPSGNDGAFVVKLRASGAW